MDDAPPGHGSLDGAWVLVVGGDLVAGSRLRAALADAGCSAVELATDLEDAIERTVAARPDAVLALPGLGASLSRRLDPLSLEAGPPVVEARDGDDGAVIAELSAALERHRLRRRLRELEALAADRALGLQREVAAVRADALARLGRAAEYRDDNTWEHTQRVAATAARLARRLGADDTLVELIRLAAPLHDLGKIAIPDYILLKPDRLTDEEFEVVKTHAAIGASILSEGDSDVMQVAEQIAGAHHERWDGSGYPGALAGERIPLVGRIVAVADTFDILVHERPWKERWTVEDAGEEIRRSAGTHFDPAVVAAFEDLGAATLLALSDEI